VKSIGELDRGGVMGKFRELIVWQRAKDLAVYMYRHTAIGEFSKDYGLRDQIRRASVSIPSNIAEGDELGSDKQSIRYFYTAKGSSAEVLTQAIIAREIDYLPEETFSHIENECQSISKMLNKLIQSRSN
jgi:four helix bundle protein